MCLLVPLGRNALVSRIEESTLASPRPAASSQKHIPRVCHCMRVVPPGKAVGEDDHNDDDSSRTTRPRPLEDLVRLAQHEGNAFWAELGRTGGGMADGKPRGPRSAALTRDSRGRCGRRTPPIPRLFRCSLGMFVTSSSSSPPVLVRCSVCTVVPASTPHAGRGIHSRRAQEIPCGWAAIKAGPGCFHTSSASFGLPKSEVCLSDLVLCGHPTYVASLVCQAGYRTKRNNSAQ